ncbi:MAG: hypothetical protein KGK44_10545 [Gammaproteobacteria bacterium]|nr:hypothetical protein [Gammaproteobacteria bacterium]
MLKISVLTLGAASMILAGCAITTSEMLANPSLTGGPSQGANVGVIRYLAQGSPADIQLRQQDANVKMSNACQDKYRVISTSVNNQLSISGAGRWRADAQTTNYIYIRFVCTGP